MARTVLKFGGTSVGDLDRIANVADIVAARAKQGEHMAVVVSAMAGETNKLVALAEGAAGSELKREQYDDEYDVVVASGEQVTAGLLALALRNLGVMYETGQGVRADRRKAIEFYRRAAEAGDEGARQELQRLGVI